LGIAQGPATDPVLPEMLCFHAQQAVEKSLKAVLLAHGVSFPRTHNLRVLVDLLPAALARPGAVDEAVGLTDYAALARYPGEYEPVSDEEYRAAVRLAEAVVEWAKGVLAGCPGDSR